MGQNLTKAPLEGEYLGKNEIYGDLYPSVYVDMTDDCGITTTWTKHEPVPKLSFWGKVKERPWPYVLFCMQMFWPVVLLAWAVGRQFWG